MMDNRIDRRTGESRVDYDGVEAGSRQYHRNIIVLSSAHSASLGLISWF
jgi:hypothetical protein